MINHTLHFLLKHSYIIIAAFRFNAVTAGNHPKGWKTFANKVETGIINAEKVYRIYSLDVESDFCQIGWCLVVVKLDKPQILDSVYQNISINIFVHELWFDYQPN
jgi:hypothetical protein